MEWIIGIATGVITFAITGPIGFFAGRLWERRYNPVIWTFEAIVDDRTRWRLTRTAGGVARNVAWQGGGNGLPPIALYQMQSGPGSDDIAEGKSVEYELQALGGSIAGSRSLVWIDKRLRLGADVTILAGTSSIEIKRIDAKPWGKS